MGELNPRIELLLAEFCAGNITDASMTELNEWMDADDANRRDAEAFFRIYRDLRAFETAGQIRSEAALERIMDRVEQIRKRRRTVLIRRAAAALIGFAVVAASSTWLLSRYSHDDLISQTSLIVPGSTKAVLILDDGKTIDLESTRDTAIHLGGHGDIQKTGESLNYQHVEVDRMVFNTVKIPRGGRHNLVLSDGTKVWLNAETQLRFPVKFIGTQREVTLTGEAYFEVSHDQSKPFLVQTTHSTIRVYGTSFNVMSYPDDQNEETTLVKGSVGVAGLSGETHLLPGQQARISQSGGSAQVRNVDTNLYTAWTNGIFRFESMELDDLTKKLARWYDVDFVFGTEDLKHRRFTGAVRESTGFDFFMRLIGETTDVSVVIENRMITVAPKTN